MRKSMLALLAASLGAACTPTVLDAEDYDTTCAADGDCAIVLLGDQCMCGVQNAAVNVTDVEQAEADIKAARAACPPDLSGRVCAAPGPATAVCTEGKCVAEPGL